MKRPAATLATILVLVVLFFILLVPRIVQVGKLKERSQNLDAELKKLKTENQILENRLRLLRDDPVYLEKVARQKLNKAKEGEIVYKVVHEGETATAR